MRFDNGSWLFMTLIAPLIGALIWWLYLRSIRALESTFDRARLFGLIDRSLWRRRAWSIFIHSIALAVGFIALAGPRYGISSIERARVGIDIAIALDLSSSMLARDVKPDRFSRAKIEVESLLKNFDGARFALIAFAGSAFIESPLTFDSSSIKLFLDALEPGDIPVEGTNLADAIEKSIEALDERSSANSAIVLFSDAENLEGSIEESIALARDRKIPLSLVGFGSESGSPIPEFDPEGAALVGYKKDKNGALVISRLDESIARRLTSETGGVFVRAPHEGSELIAALGALEKGEIDSMAIVEERDRGRVLVLVLIALILVEYLFFSEAPLRGGATGKERAEESGA